MSGWLNKWIVPLLVAFVTLVALSIAAFCRFWRSPIALKLIIALSRFATVSGDFLWDDQVVERLRGRFLFAEVAI